MKTKILLLEDETDVFTATKQAFKSIDFTIVDNLLELNGILLKDPGIQFFDYVWLDLAIEMPNIPMDIIKQEIPKMFTDENGIPNMLSYVAGIYLRGLDYYKYVVCQNAHLKDYKTTKFVLFSGHKALVEKYKLLEGYEGVPFVKKSGSDSFDELRKTIKQ